MYIRIAFRTSSIFSSIQKVSGFRCYDDHVLWRNLYSATDKHKHIKSIDVPLVCVHQYVMITDNYQSSLDNIKHKNKMHTSR